MNRPRFNKFAKGDPQQDFNERMRKYVLYLESREVICTRLEREHLNYQRDYVEVLHGTMEENHELRRSMKILRKQIINMFKEEGDANQAATV